jgi:outer membrane lipopolysaccharide assembly protein LptE/RlpB
MKRLLLALALALLAGGCGYHLAGRGAQLPTDVRSLYIGMFTNGTYHPFLENVVTNAVTDQFLTNGGLRLVESRDQADAVLSGKVASYSTDSIAYDRNDAILEYRARLTVRAVLRRVRDGRILWKGDVSWSRAYPADRMNVVAQQDNEAAAIQKIGDRVAAELYSRIMDNF